MQISSGFIMIIFAIVTTVFLGVLLYRVIRDKGFNFVKKELFLMLVHETALLINGIIVVTGGFKSTNVEHTELGEVITTILLWFVLLESQMWVLWDLAFMYWVSSNQLLALSNVIAADDPEVFEKIHFKVKMNSFRQIYFVSHIVIFVLCLINSTLSVLYIDLGENKVEYLWIGSGSSLFLVGLTIIILLIVSLKRIT